MHLCFIGLFISTICDEETSAIHMALGSFYPDVLLSGILWPIEGMPIFLRKIVYFLPQTFAIESLRCVLSRGNWNKKLFTNKNMHFKQVFRSRLGNRSSRSLHRNPHYLRLDYCFISSKHCDASNSKVHGLNKWPTFFQITNE